MRNALGGNLLIGALLERLGSAQAQALLHRLDRWVSQENRADPPPRTEDRRRRPESGNHRIEESIASNTQKDPS